MTFEFATATRIVFGLGTLAQAAPAAAEMGTRALVVVGGSASRSEQLLSDLSRLDFPATPYPVTEEPTVQIVQEGAAAAHLAGCDVVIGMGGGSVLDTAKAVAALLTNRGDVLDYLEVIGKGQTLRHPSAPCIAIPTTAGTGAEVTRNAVLASPEHRVKVSLRSPLMLPRLAVVDPELTYTMPAAVTASTGMDALTQLIEPFVSIRANPMTDALCREAIPRMARALPIAYEQGDDVMARREMSLGSLFGGLALANAGLGAVHGFAGVIGGMYPAAHGAVCARLLPFTVDANMKALRRQESDSIVLRRYREVARMLTGHARADIPAAVSWLADLGARLGIPGLKAYGVGPADIPGIVEKAARASSMRANPVRLSADEMHDILEAAL